MEKKYVRKIMKKLQCSKKRKLEIGRQLLGDIDSEKSRGSSMEQIMEKMGKPAEVAQKFNIGFSKEETKVYRKEKRREVLSVVGVILLLIVIAVFWAFPRTTALEHSSVFDAEEVQARAEEVIHLVAKGDYETIREFCTPQMQKAINAESLDEVKSNFKEDWGEFVSFGKVYLNEVKQMGSTSAVVQMNAAYENISLTYTLSFDKDMKLEGLWMK